VSDRSDVDAKLEMAYTADTRAWLKRGLTAYRYREAELTRSLDQFYSGRAYSLCSVGAVALDPNIHIR